MKTLTLIGGPFDGEKIQGFRVQDGEDIDPPEDLKIEWYLTSDGEDSLVGYYWYTLKGDNYILDRFEPNDE